MQRFDKVVLITTIFALAVWVVWPDRKATGFILLVLAALHASRLLRWKGQNTATEPLVWILHAGYAFVPFGGLVIGLSILFPQTIGLTASQHVWMAGAIGLVTLAVTIRATLGHTGRDLHAGPATLCNYLALIGSVAVRLGAGAFPGLAMILYYLSALLWIGAFGGFAVFYGPLLLRSKPLSA